MVGNCRNSTSEPRDFTEPQTVGDSLKPPMTNEAKYGILGPLPAVSVFGHRHSIDSFFKESPCKTEIRKVGIEFVVPSQS